MSNVIHFNFRKSNLMPASTEYSVDIYCGNLKRYQLDVLAVTIEDAYTKILKEVVHFNLKLIKCFILFEGLIAHRKKIQAGVKMWEDSEIEASLA